ncbi:MAG: hypothetical protein M1335_02605, partial [Chloroflexi bacterium]|nr:hypothetical protein [Chloroflexota bacterium]
MLFRISAVLTLSTACFQAGAAEIQAGELRLKLDSQTGKLVSLKVGASTVPLRAPAVLFQIRDVKGRTGFLPLTGKIRESGEEYVMQASVPPLGLNARISFRASGTMLAWRADLVNTRGDERGFVISMTLPIQDSGLVWSGDLYQSEAAQPGKLYGNNITPVSAVRGPQSHWAIAAAIPPTAPVMFDTHFKDGDFGLYYYVG